MLTVLWAGMRELQDGWVAHGGGCQACPASLKLSHWVCILVTQGQRSSSSVEIAMRPGCSSDGDAPLSRSVPHFDDRESARVAEAALEVVARRCDRYADGEEAWEAFIDWRGRGEGDYLRRIRAEGKYVFYSVVQDLYRFAENTCGEDVSEAIGQQLTDALLADHVPELLQSTLAETADLSEQIIWLVRQFVEGTCGAVYVLQFERHPDGKRLRGSWQYRARKEMVDYLKRSGHDPDRAFAYSFNVFSGALRSLLASVVQGYTQDQLLTELHPPHGSFVLELSPDNRFHYENLIDILLGYVRRLRERTSVEREPATADAALHVSDAMKRTWERMRHAAASDETVLLCGESGTGKSYYARRIHEMSSRRDGPFVEVGLTADVGSDNLIQSNLFGHVRGAFTGALDEKRGLFSLADGGTMLLDEVGDASPELQAKLLRAIETKRFKMLGGVEDLSVDVRVIAATNRDLPDMVRQERFREDLYYRLNVIPITLPPLRRRAEDLPALAERLFERIARQAKKPDAVLSGEALRVLSLHHWPGNVRELENALRHALAFSDEADILADCLPESVRRAAAGAGAVPEPAGPGSVVDHSALKAALAAVPRPESLATHDWPGHVDYARRAYLAALIDHYHGDLREIARHWDRSSEHTLRKLIRQFGLQERLQAARAQRG